MKETIVRIYDYIRQHKPLPVLLFFLVTIALIVSVSQQTYKEDISDFLPLNNKYGEAMRVYQDISGANRMVVIFQYKDTAQTDPDTICAAIDTFISEVQRAAFHTPPSDIISRIDVERMEEVTDFVYSNIPYFLTLRDYARMDSLLRTENYVSRQMAANKQMLMFPVAGFFSENVQRDPLNLFTPVVAQLQQRQADASYEDYDGYIFSPDMQRGLVIMTSPFGNSETEQNALLLRQLQACADATESRLPAVSIRFTGGPVIAVGNSNQIKTDSAVAVTLAIVLIAALLFSVFRKVRNLLLIVVSIAWGWLFAMGILALIHSQLSVIVIGISSVILGIAVNYPLHLIAHLKHSPDIKSALKDIAMPLLVGNVTTVGAFLALVPLKSVALRDLGLFSALLLIGTILFVLFCLPHLVRPKLQSFNPSTLQFFTRVSEVRLENKRWLVWTVVVLTVIFSYFSLFTSFDANISHINYMTDTQKADMGSLRLQPSSLNPPPSTVYVVSSDTLMDEALDRNRQVQPMLQELQRRGLVSDINSCSQFLSSKTEQRQRLARWQSFVTRYSRTLESSIAASARDEGFAPSTFTDFTTLMHTTFEPQPPAYFQPLSSTVFANSLATDSLHRRCHVVTTLSVEPEHVAEVVALIDSTCQMTDASRITPRTYAFDIAGMNSSIATRLSDDFNYIGWACGLIVFLFLWFSMGSIELAMLSFLPMAVSWVWILGIMTLLGIQFNVVNVILATFIFGQGDDYTIFITEGCQYEYAYRRKMLASYKYSIIISALIMFIGIGTLIFARHPALHSLAQVTIVGMTSVVLMAWLFPPLIFNWLVSNKNGYRLRPLTLKTLLGFKPDNDNRSLVRDRYRYKGVEICTAVRKNLRQQHNLPALAATLAIRPGLTICLTDNSWGEIPLLLALEYPDTTFVATMSDEDRLAVATHSAATLAPNLTFTLA